MIKQIMARDQRISISLLKSEGLGLPCRIETIVATESALRSARARQ